MSYNYSKLGMNCEEQTLAFTSNEKFLSIDDSIYYFNQKIEVEKVEKVEDDSINNYKISNKPCSSCNTCFV